MPVDKDVFAFRLRQSDDFACSLKWNQNLLYLNSGNRICSLPSRGEVADAMRSTEAKQTCAKLAQHSPTMIAR